MDYVMVASQKMPVLGLGTWQLEGEDCTRAVSDALDLGYRHIDTAQMYGNEGEIGTVLAGCAIDRAELFITTKIDNHAHAPADVERTTVESLRRLQTDFVDLLLIHWPVDYDRLGETLEAMTSLVDRGLVRAVGVSNFTRSQFEHARSLAPVACNQVEYHPFLDQSDLLEATQAAGAVLTAYSPIARGGVLSDNTLREISAAHGVGPAQVALRWLLDQEGVVVVPKATGREHLAANFDVFDFALTGEERQRIDGLARGERLIDPDFAPKWED